MSNSGFTPWLKNVACLSPQIPGRRDQTSEANLNSASAENRFEHKECRQKKKIEKRAWRKDEGSLN